MKKIVFYIFLLLLTGGIVLSCKKKTTYPEGPKISLLPKKMRMIGVWKLSSFEYPNKQVQVVEGETTLLQVKKNGEYAFYWYNNTSMELTEKGVWGFDKPKQRFTTLPDNTSNMALYDIIQLKNRQVKLRLSTALDSIVQVYVLQPEDLIPK